MAELAGFDEFYAGAYRRVGVGHLELDTSGRYLLYAVEGTFLRTSWVDLSGRRARVIVGQFNAMDPEQTPRLQGRRLVAPAAVPGL